MSVFPDYERYDGLGLAALIRSGDLSAETVLEAAIERIEARNPAYNAVVHKLYDRARASLAAGLPEGPFTGVPFLLKDLYSFLEGAPCENGSRLMKGFVTDENSPMTERCLAAGLVMLGKTATSEFGLSVTTETAACGATRNPWDPTRSTGGSSGGAGAAVASGMVPMAHGSDGGGSIRIPASECGLFGLKVTRARNPSGEGWAGLATHHAITRSVRDSAALLDATAGIVPGYPYAAPDPARPFLEEVGADPGRLRIAWSWRHHPAQVAVAPECRAAVEAAAALAEGLGHHLEEAAPTLDHEALDRAILTIVKASMAETLDQGHPLEQRPVRPEDVERMTWAMAEGGRATSAVDYIRAVEAAAQVGVAMGRFMEDYDVLLSPTLAVPPPRLGEIDTQNGELDAVIAQIIPVVSFTRVMNMSGQPAASLPLHWSDEGLPIGVQISTRLGDEATLLRLAAQLESAKPWFDRRPADLPEA